VPASALLLALAAAVVHASWNLLLADRADIRAATAVAAGAGTLCFAPVAVLTWRLHEAALPYLIPSAGLETLYLLLLALGYSRAAMSFVYPIARGSAPVIVLLISALALGVTVSATSAAGVVTVALGIVLVRGLRSSGSGRDLALALTTGAAIAGYTLIDQHGIRHANAISYLEVDLGLGACVLLGSAWHDRGGEELRAALGPRTVLAGIGMFASYLLVLAALRLASAAPVAAVRESGVVFATGFLFLTGRERVTVERLLGSVAVVAGIVLISLG